MREILKESLIPVLISDKYLEIIENEENNIGE
jgi:hypothetical protein